jgi:hypothetical protein
MLAGAIDTHAIEFDLWRTGMSLKEIIAVARSNDIPLFPNKVYSGGKGFNPNRINENFYKSTTFAYQTDLLGKHCVVKLLTTGEEPKWLYEIEVDFTGAMQDKGFYEELIKILSSKYGRPGTRKETVFSHYLWKPELKSEVVLKWYSHPILHYIDTEIKEVALTQRSYKYQDNKNGYTKRDREKF